MTQQSPRRRRLRPIHFVLSVALGLAMTLLGGLPAEASLGTIFGTVYDAASGLPAVGVTVIATGPDDVRESTVTDALGTYSIAPAYGYGDYDIQAGSSDYVWSPLASEAPRTITFDGSLGATDFTLHRGLPITGIVRDATDGITPLAGIVVGASDLADTQVYFDRATSPL